MPRRKGKKRIEQLSAARPASKKMRLTHSDDNNCERPCAFRKKTAKMCSEQHCQDGQTWALAHVDQINRLLSDLVCPECKGTGLSVRICEGEHSGFASRLSLTCVTCDYQKSDMSSPRIKGSDKSNVAYDINLKMVMFSHEVGGSHSVLKAFGATIGMPSMNLTTYQTHDKKVTAAEIDAASEMLGKSAKAVREAYADTDPVLREKLDRGEAPVIDITVSFDGTWQKQGFTSLFGAGICIDVLTGLVVDYCVMSKYCHACKLKAAKNLPAAELASWKQQHVPDCSQNHDKSSKAMEQEAAKLLWGRSEERHQFRYTGMLSDGDSTSYKAVTEMNPYTLTVLPTRLFQ